MTKAYEEVYSLVQKVPAGRVTTYGAIAKKLRLSPRTVGHILHLNPDSTKTPCHRVVNRDGRIAPGYAFGGLEKQREILELEGIEFKDSKHLDLQKYFFADF